MLKIENLGPLVDRINEAIWKGAAIYLPYSDGVRETRERRVGFITHDLSVDLPQSNGGIGSCATVGLSDLQLMSEQAMAFMFQQGIKP